MMMESCRMEEIEIESEREEDKIKKGYKERERRVIIKEKN